MQNSLSMKLLLNTIVLIFILTFFSSCEKYEVDIDAPKCVRKHIVEEKPIRVSKWIIDGEVYYYIQSDCCDQYNWIYSEDCKFKCAPDGGFTGGGDGNCGELGEASSKEVIWEK